MGIKLTPCIAAVLAMPITATALAQETHSGDLGVIGAIDPEPCATALSNEGVADFGTIGAVRIRATAETELTDKKTVTLTVTCPASTTVAFSVTENRTGTASPGGTASTNFGLGNVNSEGKLGRYTATLRNGKAGGSNANFAYRSSGTGGFSNTSASRALNSAASATQYTWVASGGTTPLSNTAFIADVEIQAWLASRAEMKGVITDEVPLDGSLTLTFVTGL